MSNTWIEWIEKMKLRPVDPKVAVSRVRMFLYGPSGVGKTILAASSADVPEMCPVLFCDCDRGLLSVQDRTEGIQFVELSNYSDVSRIFRAVPNEDFPFRTVVVDGFGELYNFQMEIRTQVEGHDLPELRDWYHMIWLSLSMLRKMKQLPIHFIFTALSAFDKEEATGRMYRRPALRGQLANGIAEHFDIFGHLTVKVGRKSDSPLLRELQLQPFGRVAAKTRASGLPAVMENPTMSKIYAAVIAGKEVQNAVAKDRK